MFGSILRQLSLSGDEDGQFLSHWLNSLEKRASLSLKIDQVIALGSPWPGHGIRCPSLNQSVGRGNMGFSLARPWSRANCWSQSVSLGGVKFRAIPFCLFAYKCPSIPSPFIKNAVLLPLDCYQFAKITIPTLTRGPLVVILSFSCT